MNLELEQPTIKAAALCVCGKRISDEHRALVAAFPRVLRAGQCEGCREDEERGKAAEVTAQRAEAEQHRRALRLDEIPPEMRRTTLNHPEFNPGLWVRVEGWEPADLRWLGIVGGAGECKTRCLALLAKRLILEGHRLLWTTAVDFQDKVDESLNGERGDIRTANQYFMACKVAPVLVFDDFGKNSWNATTERRMFSLIDWRKTHDLPMLWTANSNPLEILASGQLSRDRGAPLIGRLMEASKIETV